jgi:phage-related protein
MVERDDTESGVLKPVIWMASSRKDLKKFPKGVRLTIGQALFDAQTGGKHPDAKPLKGFGGAGVLEVVEDQQFPPRAG